MQLIGVPSNETETVALTVPTLNGCSMSDPTNKRRTYILSLAFQHPTRRLSNLHPSCPFHPPKDSSLENTTRCHPCASPPSRAPIAPALDETARA